MRSPLTDTRDRLVEVSATLLQRQGLTGTGIKQILAEAGAPYSSLYHHFPGGKDELAATAIRASGARYQALVEAVWDQAPDVIERRGAPSSTARRRPSSRPTSPWHVPSPPWRSRWRTRTSDSA